MTMPSFASMLPESGDMFCDASACSAIVTLASVVDKTTRVRSQHRRTRWSAQEGRCYSHDCIAMLWPTMLPEAAASAGRLCAAKLWRRRDGPAAFICQSIDNVLRWAASARLCSLVCWRGCG